MVKFWAVVPTENETPIVMFNDNFCTIEDATTWRDVNYPEAQIEEYNLKIR